MTIEQKPELNRYVDPSIPLTWRYRWRQLKLLLPIWIFAWVCLLETGIFQAWAANRLSFGLVLADLGGGIALLLFLFGILEVGIRLRQRSKRVLRIDDNRIVVKPARNQFLRLKQISKFQFEPIAEAPTCTKLRVFTSGSKRQGRAFWSMVLESPTQMRELIGCLQMKEVAASARYEIEIVEKPLQPESPVPISYLGISLYLGGMFLLLHGVPLLFVALSRGHSGHDSDMTEDQRAKFGRWIASHFSSVDQLRHFSLCLGLALTVLGLAMLIWGGWSMKRQRFARLSVPPLASTQ